VHAIKQEAIELKTRPDAGLDPLLFPAIHLQYIEPFSGSRPESFSHADHFRLKNFSPIFLQHSPQVEFLGQVSSMPRQLKVSDCIPTPKVGMSHLSHLQPRNP